MAGDYQWKGLQLCRRKAVHRISRDGTVAGRLDSVDRTGWDGDLLGRFVSGLAGGNLFVAALVERVVRRVDMVEGQAIGQEILFGELAERMRDLRVGPERALFLPTDNDDGRVLRVMP